MATITMSIEELKKSLTELPKLYTAEEVAKAYQMNERYVRNEVNCGSLKGVKIANCWRFSAADVQEWIENKKSQK